MKHFNTITSHSCRILILTTIIVTIFSCGDEKAKKYTNPPNKVDEKFGFKDITLEKHINLYKEKLQLEVDLQHPDFNYKIYQVNNEEYFTIGEIKLKGINISTIDDTIKSITILQENKLIYEDALLKTLMRAYGETKIENKDGRVNATWIGNRTLLSYRAQEKLLSIIEADLSSQRLGEKYLEYTKKTTEQTKKNSNDL
jgi:hypothetical protein